MSDLYYKVDFDFDNFQFWSGARDRMQGATEKQKEQVKQRVLDYCFSDEHIPTETEINDLVWFECDDIFFPEEDEEEVEVEESSKPKDVTLSRKEGRKEKESLQEIEEALKMLDGSVSEEEVEESSKPKDVTLSRKEGRKSKEQQLDEANNANDMMTINIDKETYKDWLFRRTRDFYACDSYSDDFWNEIIDYIVDNEMIDPDKADPMYIIDNIAVNGEIYDKDDCLREYSVINDEYNGDVDAWIEDNGYNVFDGYVVLNFGY